MSRSERERQTLAVARALFAERGFADVTMDDIAAEVGVTKPLLYTYFGNKERLYLACMAPAGDALIATVLDAVGGASGPRAALREGVHAFFAFVERDREAWRVLFDETVPASGDVARRVAEYRDRLTAGVSQSLSPAARPLAHAVLGAAEALARWWLREGDRPAAETAELLVRALEDGLNPRTTSAGGTA